MRTVQDYIAIIRQNSSKITKDFGIKEITSSELVLYKLDNAGVEYYFTKD